MPNIVQIAGGSTVVYALDNNNDLWVYYTQTEDPKWIKLPQLPINRNNGSGT